MAIYGQSHGFTTTSYQNPAPLVHGFIPLFMVNPMCSPLPVISIQRHLCMASYLYLWSIPWVHHYQLSESSATCAWLHTFIYGQSHVFTTTSYQNPAPPVHGFIPLFMVNPMGSPLPVIRIQRHLCMASYLYLWSIPCVHHYQLSVSSATCAWLHTFIYGQSHGFTTTSYQNPAPPVHGFIPLFMVNPMCSPLPVIRIQRHLCMASYLYLWSIPCVHHYQLSESSATCAWLHTFIYGQSHVFTTTSYQNPAPPVHGFIPLFMVNPMCSPLPVIRIQRHLCMASYLYLWSIPCVHHHQLSESSATCAWLHTFIYGQSHVFTTTSYQNPAPPVHGFIPLFMVNPMCSPPPVIRIQRHLCMASYLYLWSIPCVHHYQLSESSATCAWLHTFIYGQSHVFTTTSYQNPAPPVHGFIPLFMVNPMGSPPPVIRIQRHLCMASYLYLWSIPCVHHHQLSESSATCAWLHTFIYGQSHVFTTTSYQNPAPPVHGFIPLFMVNPMCSPLPVIRIQRHLCMASYLYLWSIPCVHHYQLSESSATCAWLHTFIYGQSHVFTTTSYQNPAPPVHGFIPLFVVNPMCSPLPVIRIQHHLCMASYLYLWSIPCVHHYQLSESSATCAWLHTFIYGQSHVFTTTSYQNPAPPVHGFIPLFMVNPMCSPLPVIRIQRHLCMASYLYLWSIPCVYHHQLSESSATCAWLHTFIYGQSHVFTTTSYQNPAPPVHGFIPLFMVNAMCSPLPVIRIQRHLCMASYLLSELIRYKADGHRTSI